MIDEHEVAKRLMHFLDVALRRSPGMYLGTDDPKVVGYFLQGAAHAVWLCGYQIPLTYDARYGSVYEDRGWDDATNLMKPSLIEQMKEKGMDNTAMFNEIIDIEIEVIKRTLGRTD